MVKPRRHTWEEFKKEYTLFYGCNCSFTDTKDAFHANEPYIDHLEALLKEAVSVIEFYGDTDNWLSEEFYYPMGKERHDIFTETDHCVNQYCAGKRARTFLQENKEANPEPKKKRANE